MVKTFLGRPFNNAAWQVWLNEEPGVSSVKQ